MNYKSLCKEKNKILKSIKAEYSDEFTRGIEYRKNMECFFEKNNDIIDNDALLKYYKHLKIDSPEINNAGSALVLGLCGAGLYDILKFLNREDAEQAYSIHPILTIVFYILVVLGFIILTFWALNFHKFNGSYKDYTFQKIDEDILENALTKKGFYLSSNFPKRVVIKRKNTKINTTKRYL